MGASTKQGYNIAKKSREIVKSLIDEKTINLTEEEKSVVERIVHSTADPEFADLVQISPNFVEASLESLKNYEDIVTDITMVKAGITTYEGLIECYINEKKVKELAKKYEITRAAAGIQYAADNGFEGIIVVGNAPTALYKAIELKEKGELNVKSIVGVPVGFVGAADSKEALHKTDIPHLIIEGPKGGTPVAVATINSLIRISKLGKEY